MPGRSEIDCPRARTEMSPCIARDGSAALDDPEFAPDCVTCGAAPGVLIASLAERYPPAAAYLGAVYSDPRRAADLLTELVAGYVDALPADPHSKDP
jgi:hypothetical protein